MALRVEKFASLMSYCIEAGRKRGLYLILRLQDKLSERIVITNGVTQAKHRMHIVGLGIHAFTKDGRSAFGSTDRVDIKTAEELISALEAAVRASTAFSPSKNTEIFRLKPTVATSQIPLAHPLEQLSVEKKERMLSDLHVRVRALDKKLAVTSSLAAHDEHWWVARSDGTSVKHNIPYARIVHSLSLRSKTKTSTTYAMLAGADCSVIIEKDKLSKLTLKTRKAYKLACDLGHAGTLPGGHYPTLLTSTFSGLLAHEAVGHAAESDLVRSSVLGKKGKLCKHEQVCQTNISFIDGPEPGQWGDVRYSATGVRRKHVAFIKHGVLVDSLSDVFTARSVGVAINGCDRAEFFDDIAIPRMSNTRIVDTLPLPCALDPDTATPQQICQMLVNHGHLKKGGRIVFPVQGMGGQVSPEAGTFMFNCAGIYLFEYPNRVTLFGPSSFGGDIRKAIRTPMRGFGERLILTDAGMCGKSGQGAPVTDGSHPFLFIDATEAITFGGA